MRKTLFLLALLAGVVAAADRLRAEESERVPVPTTQAAEEANKLVREVYKDEYAKRGPDERRALAQKLLDDGRNNRSDPASQFVLLREARDAAAMVGDVDTAVEAVSEMGKAFLIDVPEGKLNVLNTIKASGRADAQAPGAVAASALIDESIAADNFDVAGRAADLAVAFATAAKDMSTVTEIQARRAEIKTQATAYLAMKIGADKLKRSPKDPQANSDVGIYLALYKNDWDKGLPLIAAGTDPVLAAVAKADLAAPVDVPGMTKVGDQWFDLGTARPTMKTRLMNRAEFWYNLVVPNAEGLIQSKVQKRLEQIAAGKPANSYGAVSDATRKLLPTPTEIKHLKDLYAQRNLPQQSQELYQLKETLMRRLQMTTGAPTDADFFARAKADAQLRKIFVQFNDTNYVNYTPVVSTFEMLASASKTKEEFTGRLLAFERFNGTEKVLDQPSVDNIIYSALRNYLSRNMTAFSTQPARIQFCSTLKSKGVKSQGLDRYKTYLERSRSF